jgi:hypothetical protein
MRELQLIIKDVTLVPSSYYDAVEEGSKVSQDVLNIAKRVIRMLQERLDL